MAVLDGVEQVSDTPGFRIRSHDLHGPLPDSVIANTGERLEVLDRVSFAAAKLLAMVHSRQEIERMFLGCEFLPPTSTDDTKVVGIRIGRGTVLAQAKLFWEAYHQLERNIGV